MMVKMSLIGAEEIRPEAEKPVEKKVTVKKTK